MICHVEPEKFDIYRQGFLFFGTPEGTLIFQSTSSKELREKDTNYSRMKSHHFYKTKQNISQEKTAWYYESEYNTFMWHAIRLITMYSHVQIKTVWKTLWWTECLQSELSNCGLHILHIVKLTVGQHCCNSYCMLSIVHHKLMPNCCWAPISCRSL